MIILGIDPGMATIGIGVIECDGVKLSVLHSGWIETSKDDGAGERLLQIHKEMKDVIQKHKPDVLAIERLFFFINHKTAMAVAESIGVIKLAAEAEGIQVVSFAPLEIKYSVAGNGKANKEVMKTAVRKILGIRSPDKKKTHFDDLCDALAVGICYANKNLLPQVEKVGCNRINKKNTSKAVESIQQNVYNKPVKKWRGVKKING